MAKDKGINRTQIPSYSLETFRPIHRTNEGSTHFGYNQIDSAKQIKGFELYSSTGMKGRLGPIRSEFYRLSLTISGTHTVHLGLLEYTAKPGTLFFTSPHQIFSKDLLSEDTFGYYLLFKADFMEPILPAGRIGEEFPFYDYTGTPLFQVTKEELQPVEGFLIKINDELQQDKPGKEVAIRMYLYLLMLEAKRSYQRQGLHQEQGTLDNSSLVSKFKKLVSQHFLLKRQVADYADLLRLTSNYLNRVVKEVSGKTASETITDMLLQESKIMLKYTDLTVSEISYQLDFSDPASFNRFFKKTSGITPLQFRMQG